MSYPERRQNGRRRKGLLFLVSIVALAVWGVVLYQLTAGLRGAEEPVEPAAPESVTTEMEAEAVIPAYRGMVPDVFRPPASLRAPSSSPKEPRPEPEDADPPVITLQLAGVVDGMALLAADDGPMHLVREGEVLRNHRVLQVGGDYVLLEVEDRRDTVRLHPRERALTIR